MEQIRPTNSIEINGTLYSPDEFKNLVAKIATKHNMGEIKDEKLIEYFSEREDAWSKTKELQVEFQKFQHEYMSKLQAFTGGIMKLKGIVENAEAKIVKRYTQST